MFSLVLREKRKERIELDGPHEKYVSSQIHHCRIIFWLLPVSLALSLVLWKMRGTKRRERKRGEK